MLIVYPCAVTDWIVQCCLIWLVATGSDPRKLLHYLWLWACKVWVPSNCPGALAREPEPIKKTEHLSLFFPAKIRRKSIIWSFGSRSLPISFWSLFACDQQLVPLLGVKLQTQHMGKSYRRHICKIIQHLTISKSQLSVLQLALRGEGGRESERGDLSFNRPESEGSHYHCLVSCLCPFGKQRKYLGRLWVYSWQIWQYFCEIFVEATWW